MFFAMKYSISGKSFQRLIYFIKVNMIDVSNALGLGNECQYSLGSSSPAIRSSR